MIPRLDSPKMPRSGLQLYPPEREHERQDENRLGDQNQPLFGVDQSREHKQDDQVDRQVGGEQQRDREVLAEGERQPKSQRQPSQQGFLPGQEQGRGGSNLPALEQHDRAQNEQQRTGD
ncbi:MAG: hypothetical protein M5U05_03850 [Anaerolineales bacterium]|nr:hypothetical protein [Anaerolineales bacterium]